MCNYKWCKKCISSSISVSSQDGLTHQKTPFLNILCSGVHNHNALLEIVDCTDHCAEGNKKDAQYIADTMKPHILKIDPSKQCVDFVIFDGASNVQKGGKILEAYDPRITSVHGACHNASLVCQDVTEQPEVQLLVKLHKKFRNLFGSVRHGPHALFRKHSKQMNNGVYLGFVKPADTRMAGNLIALLRFLRLREALVATTVSAEFRKMKMPWAPFCAILQMDSLWRAIFALCCAMYAMLRLLRMADMKIPAMGKVRWMSFVTLNLVYS